MAKRFPQFPPHQGIQPGDSSILPPLVGVGNIQPQQHQQQSQQAMFGGLGMGTAGAWSSPQQPQIAMAGPMQFPQSSVSIHLQQQQQPGGKDRNYLQQQQKLRAMSSTVTKKTGPLSADSLIEDLLQRQETFSMRSSQPQVTPEMASTMTRQGDTPSLDMSKSAEMVLGQEQSAVESGQGFAGGTNRNLPAPVGQGLPLWLAPEAYELLPAIYRRVWELTKMPVSDSRELVDTGRIFSILLTSGLPRDALGYIWGLANTGIPGVLSRYELNVCLALVALAQSGWHNYTSAAVLSMVKQPPLPILQIEGSNEQTMISSSPSQLGSSTQTIPAIQTNIPQQIFPTVVQQNQIPQSSIQANIQTSIQPNAPILEKAPITQELFNLEPISPQILHETKASPQSSPTSKTPNIPQKDLLDDNDDFTDFQSAAPVLQTSVAEAPKHSFFSPRDSPLGFNTFESPPASPVHTKPKGSREVGSRLANYSFCSAAATSGPTSGQKSTADDKDNQAESSCIAPENLLFPKCNIKPPPVVKSTPFLKETMIRHEQKLDTKNSAPTKSDEDKYSALRELSFDTNSEQVTQNNQPSSDDFGDFLSAGPLVDDSFAELSNREPPSGSAIPNLISETSNPEPEEWSANFDAFSSSNATSNAQGDWGEQSITVLPPTESTIPQSEEEEEDFGEFVGPSCNLSAMPHLIRLKEASNITPDTQSVASLELGGFDTLSLGGAGATSSPEGGVAELRNALEGVAWETATAALQEEGREWQRCLQSCLALLQTAGQILGAIDDPHVVDEVVTSREGEDYLANLLEVYSVTQRISVASQQLLTSSQNSLEPLLREVDQAWAKLCPFLARSTLEVQEERKWNVGSAGAPSCCGLCLVFLDDTPSDSSSTLVRSGQHCYHASCANLWTHCVDAHLPSVSVS